VATIVGAIAITAVVVLAEQERPNSWTPVLQDLIKTAYTALAVGALGGLAKLVLDKRKQLDAAATELRGRRQAALELVAEASNKVDTARLSIRANRSVRTWSDQVNGAIVSARTALRSLAHAVTNWEQAGLPLFPEPSELATKVPGLALPTSPPVLAPNPPIFLPTPPLQPSSSAVAPPMIPAAVPSSNTVAPHELEGQVSNQLRGQLQFLCDYLLALIEEHAENKQRLAEQQREAEVAANRESALSQLWHEMMRLPLLADFLGDGPKYAEYRSTYLDILRYMRSAMAASVRAP
jgi:hypothetical protein